MVVREGPTGDIVGGGGGGGFDAALGKEFSGPRLVGGAGKGSAKDIAAKRRTSS